MLGNRFRFRIQNTQNQAITVGLRYRLWKFSQTGEIVYSATQQLPQMRNSGDTAFVAQPLSISATSGTTYTEPVDNDTASSRWIGAEILLTTQAAANTNGTGFISVTLERSTDGGLTWPTAGQGEFVGGYTVVAGDGTNLRLKNLSVD